MGREPRDEHPVGKMTSLDNGQGGGICKSHGHPLDMLFVENCNPAPYGRNTNLGPHRADKTDDIVDDQEAMLEN